MTLRPYQIEAIEAMQASPNHNGLVVMPTGTGKTIVFTEFIRTCSQDRFLILTERIDLQKQTYEKLLKFIPDRTIGRVGNGYKETDADIVVATIQTLQKIYKDYAPDYFDYILIDEAHHTKASTYKILYDYFDVKRCFGFTATPNEHSTIFLDEDTVFRYTLLKALEEGYLSPIAPYTVSLKYDFATIKYDSKSDYTKEEIEVAIKKNIGTNFDILYETITKYSLQRLVVYMPTKDLAIKFTEFLEEKGKKARCIHCDIPTSLREQYIQEFQNNPEVILVNIMILTEGIDIPEIESIIVCRPTKNRALYKQIIGRGLRLSPHTGKKKCTIIDCVYNNMGMIYGETSFSALLDLDQSIANHALEKCQEELRELLTNNPKSLIEINRIISVGLEQYIPKPLDFINDYNLYYEYDQSTQYITGFGNKYSKEKKDYIPLYWQIIPIRNGYQAFFWKDTVKTKTLQESFDYINKQIQMTSNVTRTTYRTNDMTNKNATDKQKRALCRKLSAAMECNTVLSEEAIYVILSKRLEELTKLECYQLLNYYMGNFEKTKQYYKKLRGM